MAKTTKAVHQLIEFYEHQRDAYLEILRVREYIDKESWSEYTTKCTPEFVSAHMNGVISMLESMMHQQNCYHGFTYVNSNGGFIQYTDPSFVEWSRSYFVK